MNYEDSSLLADLAQIAEREQHILTAVDEIKQRAGTELPALVRIADNSRANLADIEKITARAADKYSESIAPGRDPKSTKEKNL